MENGYEKAKLPVSDDDLRNADHDLSLGFQGACNRQPDRFRFDPDPKLHLEAAFGLYHPEKPFGEGPDPRCWVRENRQDLLAQICSQGEPRRIPSHAGHERAAGPGAAGVSYLF